MGKALYRKHRSRTFGEVVGQQHVTDTLENALKKGAISHAYLFTGPKGVGKTSVARILAHAVNGLEYSDDSDHLDIIEIDAASNRRIDEIRELRDKIHIAPTSARYKVYIIDEVHMLTREAFNALLKTLEEPPDHALFILATTEAYKVPDTIISRTQRFSFHPVDTVTLQGHLQHIAQQEGLLVDPAALELLARRAKGSFRDGISALDQLSGLCKDSYSVDDVRELLGLPPDESIESLLQSVLSNDTTQLFKTVHELRLSGVDSSQAAQTLSRTIRDKLVKSEQQSDLEKLLALLNNLLPLTNSTSDFTRFELALLSAVDFSNRVPSTTHSKRSDEKKKLATTSSTLKQPTPKPRKTSETDEPPQKPPEARPASVSATSTPTKSWGALLDDMKGHHNTLYGILRMAEVDDSKNELTLYFQFDFHKKRLESSDHKAILKTYINKHFGQTAVTVVVRAEKAAREKAASTPSIDREIASVSNIFGGAELLE